MWNPPITDEKLGTRRSVLSEAADLLAELVVQGARTIVFMKSRKAVELMAKFTQLALEDLGHPKLAERIAPYRAGYTPQQRRELERRLVEGELLGVVSTDALELGIDIGSLDAAICVTFPGTVASLRQQWGRAGRRGRGLAVYIAGEDALDQFFCRHPDEFLDRPVENAILDHENEQIHAAHILCAAHEGPLVPSDGEYLGRRWKTTAERLVSAGHLRERPGGQYVPRRPDEYPAANVSLRSAGRDGFVIVDTGSGELLGTVDAARAFTTTHEGAIYLHGGRSFEVAELDLDQRRVLVQPFSGDWYTQPKKETDTQIERLLDRREAMGVTLSFGTVTVTEQVLAYQRKRMADHEILDLVGLDLPQTSFTTQALWYELDSEVLADDFPLEVMLGALHAAEHSQIAVLPLLAMCDRWDIGGLSTNLHPQTGGPTIFIYDGHPGGIGITRRGFLVFDVARRRRPPPDQRVPVREGLPVVRAVAEVRQPQRAAVEGGRGRGDGPYARRRMTDFPHVEGVEHRFVDAAGVRLHVAEAGDRRAAPARPRLAAALVRVARADRRAEGRAAADHARPARLRLVRRAERPRSSPRCSSATWSRCSTRSELEQVDVVGHDWGGFSSLLLAARHPERVRRLLAVSTPHPWLKVTPRLGLETWRAWYAALFAAGLMQRDNARLAAWFIRREGVARRGRRGVRRAAARARPRRRHDPALPRATCARSSRPSRGSNPPEPRLTVPTLLMIGARDVAVTPKLAAGFEHAGDDARTEVVPGRRPLHLRHASAARRGPRARAPRAERSRAALHRVRLTPEALVHATSSSPPGDRSRAAGPAGDGTCSERRGDRPRHDRWRGLRHLGPRPHGLPLQGDAAHAHPRRARELPLPHRRRPAQRPRPHRAAGGRRAAPGRDASAWAGSARAARSPAPGRRPRACWRPVTTSPACTPSTATAAPCAAPRPPPGARASP